MDSKLNEMAAKVMVCRHCCCIINDFRKCKRYGRELARPINPRDKIQYCSCTQDGKLSPLRTCQYCAGAGIRVMNTTCR